MAAAAFQAAFALLPPVPVQAADLPVGAEIQIRLKSKVSTRSSKPADPVEAVVIAPLMGATVRGTVEKSVQPTTAEERAVLSLHFTEIEIDGATLPLNAQVAVVDNAREKVDDQGQINGILASETLTGRLDSGLDKLAGKYSGLAGVLRQAKNVVFDQAQADVTYDTGVEMTLKLTSPLAVKGPAMRGPAAKLLPLRNRPALVSMVIAEPFQTMAERPSKPSDVTNLALIGTLEQVKQVFEAAGWSTAQKLNALAKFETIRALAEDRGYSEAPVSVLLLEGKPPDFVFEKLNNTFASRHHLRVWLRPATFQGKPVWAIAATHDVGIDFSQENRTFIHRIDSAIDRERDKVVNDLLFTGQVQSMVLVDRAKVPKNGENATGDKLETDGRIAVLVLN